MILHVSWVSILLSAQCAWLFPPSAIPCAFLCLSRNITVLLFLLPLVSFMYQSCLAGLLPIVHPCHQGLCWRWHVPRLCTPAKFEHSVSVGTTLHYLLEMSTYPVVVEVKLTLHWLIIIQFHLGSLSSHLHDFKTGLQCLESHTRLDNFCWAQISCSRQQLHYDGGKAERDVYMFNSARGNLLKIFCICPDSRTQV